MNKWKKRGKRILVFLLILGFIGGAMEHLRVTVTAADAEGSEIPREKNDTSVKDTVQPTCTCLIQCTAEVKAADCPVCREDLSSCSGKALTDNPDESKDTDTEKPEKLSADSEAAAVEELIKKLPSLEDLKTLNQEKRDAAYEQIQKAFDAYESLEEGQKALLQGAEEQLKALLEYFTELVMPLATDQQITDAWNAMTDAMINWEAEVDLFAYNLTEEDWKRIFPNVVENNPDLFYVWDVTHFTDSAGIIQKCTFTYSTEYNQNSVKEYKAAIDSVFNEVIEANMTDEQKALALHDYLVQHMVYDQNANNNLGIEKRNAYEALVNGIGVCQGYTLAYAALLNKAGIEVEYCRSKSMNHIWNYVKLDGNWYHADLTYDDIAASSQTGETGYVTHTYFLLSDDAMGKAQHSWDANDITCTDTKYDNYWHKTAPLTESAIYTVNGSSYYLKSKTVSNNPNICLGAALMKRDSNGTETEVASFEIENLGSGWPMWKESVSRLSCSKGVLYFNVGNSIYSFHPSVTNTPEKIYQYDDTNKQIVTGLLVSGNEMTLEISNQIGMIQEKIQVPVFTLSASESKVKVGYTKAPVLTANPRASGFTWSKQNANNGWDVISGANSSDYTIETGLAKGSYRYRVEAILDGKPVSAEIIITVTEPEQQKNFAFSEKSKTVTYGDADFTVTAQGAESGSSVSYSSSDSSVASVDSKTGTVRILKTGSAVITATASETDDYLEATSTYTLTVSPRELTWDVSALEAADRLDLIKDKAATLYGELKLTGILENDLNTVRFECPADKLSGIYETVAEGRQKVTLSWKSEQDKPVLQGDGKDNYTIPSALPEISGKISVVNDSILDSTDGTQFKLQVESGISKVPDALKNMEHLNTPGKIEKVMKLKIQEKYSGIADANMVIYDVELLVNIDGKGWENVTKDNFPKDGLTITLPYPSGTGRNTHDFVASHMFTVDMNGYHAGDVEYPAVTKTEKGITFKVYGLSPITIGWKGVNSSSSGGSESGDGSSKPTFTGNRTDAPPTGDNPPIMLYVLLAAAAFSVISALYIRTKKSR